MYIRRYTIYFVAISVATILSFATAYGASEYDSDEDVAFGIIGTAGTGATYELTPSRFFQSEEDFAQDIYELIYERLKHQSSNIAIERTLAPRNLSKEELLILIPGANIGELLKKGPTEQLSPAEIQKKHDELQQFLIEEKELADLEVRTKMDVEPTELFSNGDENDSGFDLITDLDIIDQILFGRQEGVLGDSGPGAPAGSNVANLGGAGSGAGGNQPSTAPGAFALGNYGSQQASVAGTDSSASAFESAASALPNAEEAAIICPLNQNFNSAVSALRAQEQAEAGGGGDEVGRVPGSEGNGNGSRRSGRLPGGGEESIDDDETAENPPPLTPEPSADWSHPRVCPGPFCLNVQLKYKTESAYLANENCIACHFEKINDAFKQTLDHNLIPNKATGNLFETPKCKRGAGGRTPLNLKWNLVLLPQPILTPPNDDLVVKGDFIKNLSEFNEKYCPGAIFEYTSVDPAHPEKKLKTCPRSRDQTADITLRELSRVSEGAELQKKVQDISKQVEKKRQEILQLVKQTALVHDAETQSRQFDVVMQELETMRTYFEGFVTVFKTLGSDQPEAPCGLLHDKPTCAQ